MGEARAALRDPAALAGTISIAVWAWLAYVGLLMLLRGGTVTLDLLAVVTALVAMALLATRAGLRELLPFGVIALAWEAMRGLSADLVPRVHAADVVAVERVLFGWTSGGRTPTEALQEAIHVPGTVGPLDAAMTAVYLGHFVAPVVIGVVLWRHDRSTYDRYAIAMIGLALAGYATQLIFPVAPPRLAAMFGASDLRVEDIARTVLDAFHAVPFASWGYGNLSGNELAALPSLHAAFPIVGAVFLARVSRRAAWLAAAWTVLVWFSIVYLGQHFVVDALLGAVYAGGICAFAAHPAFERLLGWLATIHGPRPQGLIEPGD